MIPFDTDLLPADRLDFPLFNFVICGIKLVWPKILRISGTIGGDSDRVGVASQAGVV